MTGWVGRSSSGLCCGRRIGDLRLVARWRRTGRRGVSDGLEIEGWKESKD